MTLTESVVTLRRTMVRLLTRRLSAETTRPFQQLRVLSTVARGKAETQAEVSELLVSDPATICRLVDRLEADGLMARRPGRDRRSLKLEVTEAAAPELALLRRHGDWLEQTARSALTDEEVQTLLSLLGKVHAAFADAPEAAVSSR